MCIALVLRAVISTREGEFLTSLLFFMRDFLDKSIVVNLCVP
jgi:hypothetical protein